MLICYILKKQSTGATWKKILSKFTKSFTHRYFQRLKRRRLQAKFSVTALVIIRVFDFTKYLNTWKRSKKFVLNLNVESSFVLNFYQQEKTMESPTLLHAQKSRTEIIPSLLFIPPYLENSTCKHGTKIYLILPTAWKVSAFGVILVHIFPHSNWIRSSRINSP